MPSEITINEEASLKNGCWVSEYTVKALGIEVTDSSLKVALVILRNKIDILIEGMIENA